MANASVNHITYVFTDDVFITFYSKRFGTKQTYEVIGGTTGDMCGDKNFGESPRFTPSQKMARTFRKQYLKEQAEDAEEHTHGDTHD